MTPAGEQAYQILQRAFDDHSYIGQAKADLAAIATSTQQERNEAGDAATMLSRLASSCTALRLRRPPVLGLWSRSKTDPLLSARMSTCAGCGLGRTKRAGSRASSRLPSRRKARGPIPC